MSVYTDSLCFLGKTLPLHMVDDLRLEDGAIKFTAYGDQYSYAAQGYHSRKKPSQDITQKLFNLIVALKAGGEEQIDAALAELKATRKSVFVKRLVIPAAVMIGVGCLVFSPSRSNLSKEDEDSILGWRQARGEDVESIVVRPLGGNVWGQETISRAFTVSDREKIELICERLHTSRRPLSYLKGLEHWGSSRFAKLELRLRKQERVYLCVGWHDRRPICKFALLRDGTASRYSGGNVYYERADDELPRILDDIIATNEVSWVVGD